MTPRPDLELIAARLEGLEETIISKLIDRAQFSVNQSIYIPGQSGFTGAEGLSLFDLRLRWQEEMDARFGRFHVPEERPFNRDLPASQRAVALPPSCLVIDDFERVNVTAAIRDAYLQMIPRICPAGDDRQYGSSVEHDVYALQAISRRIHFGALYVAESKYSADPASYDECAARGDTDALMRMLTRHDVEERILLRVGEKTERAQAHVNQRVRSIVAPDTVMSLYRDFIIPITKQGEILYLLQRTGSHNRF
jgi:chorismate mutase